MTWFEELLPAPGAAGGGSCRTPGEEAPCRRLAAELQRRTDEAAATLRAERASARRSQEAVEDEVRRTVDGLLAARQRVLAAAGADLAHVVATLAGRLVGAELASDPAKRALLVGSVLDGLAHATTLEVTCHVDRVGLLVAATAGRTPAVRVRPDSRLDPWDFEVRTDRGHLDARLAVQVSAAELALLAAPLDLEQLAALDGERLVPVDLERRVPVDLERRVPVDLERRVPVDLERRVPVDAQQGGPPLEADEEDAALASEAGANDLEPASVGAGCA